MKIPDSYIRKAKSILEDRVVRKLKSIGEESVSLAIEVGNYNDRTGNLRSSIGYVVSVDGIIRYEGGFRSIGNGYEGQNIGRAKAQEIANKTEGIALILVAGMEYATYLADNGYDVLDSGRNLALNLVKQLGK